MNTNTSPADAFALTIANEAMALEKILSQYNNDIHDTPRMLGKSWFAIGLESNEHETTQDNVNKQGIIKRMIDAIINFIRNFVKGFKSAFNQDPAEAKANQEYAKNYASSGPTEEQLKKAAAKATAKAAPATPAQPAQKAPHDPAADATNASKAAGEAVTPEKARAFFNGEKMALISSMLGADRMALVSAMMEPGFAKTYHQAIEIAEKWTNSHMTTDLQIIEKRIRELGEAVANCQSVIDECVKDGEDTNRKNLSKWVMGKDHGAIDRIMGYFAGWPQLTPNVARMIADYVADLEAEVKKANHLDPQVAQSHLDIVKKETKALTQFAGMMTRVDSCYCTVIKGLRK